MNTLTPIEVAAENQKVINRFFQMDGPERAHKVASELFLECGKLFAMYRREDGEPYTTQEIDNRFFEMREILNLIGGLQEVKEVA